MFSTISGATRPNSALNLRRIQSSPASLASQGTSRLSLETFSPKNVNALMIMTEWEPDDVMAIYPLLRETARTGRPLAFVSGGANAAIQNARAQKYVEACKKDGWLPDNAPITFIRGADSDQKYNKQGTDVLTSIEIEAVKDTSTGTETNKIKAFLKDNPKCEVFCLKRPDEIVGNNELLPLLKQSNLVAYAGGYNVRVENKANLKAFYDAFKSMALVQNFITLQDGQNFPKGDGTPRDISETTTPNFTKILKASKTPSATALKNNIRLWNEKILFEFAVKARDSQTNSIENPDKRQRHQEAQALLRTVLPEGSKELQISDKTLSIIQQATALLDPDAKLKDAKSGKQTLGFRVKVLDSLAKDPTGQVVIADPLATLVATRPDVFGQTTRGKTVVGDFISIEPDDKGNCLNIGPLRGTPGTTGTRIQNLDKALTEEVLGQKVNCQV